MFISNEEDLASFIEKHVVTGDIDNELLKLWLIGNEVLNFKQQSEILYFLVGVGKQGSDNRYREINLISYDLKTDKAVSNTKFRVKNITITENYDLFENLFNYYSICGADICSTDGTTTSGSGCILNEVEFYESLAGDTVFPFAHEDPYYIQVFYNGGLLPKNDWTSTNDNSEITLSHSVIADGDVVVIKECRNYDFVDAVTNEHLTNSITAAFSSLYIGSY